MFWSWWRCRCSIGGASCRGSDTATRPRGAQHGWRLDEESRWTVFRSPTATGLAVQACCDCHLGNFGLFATPERTLVFDINDFDETLRATWEWDVKRLAASLVVAARVNGFAEERCVDVAVKSAASYRGHLREFAEMSPLEAWSFHIDADDLVTNAADEEARRRREQMAVKARLRVGERLLPKITQQVSVRRHVVESPPLTTRVHDERALRIVRQGIGRYLQTLDESRRFLLDRYRLEDYARRVVGVGSVVAGQRMIQAASDILLGWLRAVKQRVARFASVRSLNRPPRSPPCKSNE